MNNYDKKVKVVNAGKSGIFNSWNENAGITKDDFLKGLEWLCNDPMPNGRLSRQLGCHVPFASDIPTDGGMLRRLRRVYYDDGAFCGFYDENGRLWGNGPSISASDRI